MAGPARKRAIVYIDGFNLYHGALRGTSNRWLNLEKYFDALRNGDDVIQVKYFTALMFGGERERQNIYLKALETLPKVSVITGKYKTKRITCKVDKCTHGGERIFTTFTEKMTDVNLAIEIVDDAHSDECDIFVVVSGDSDLVPALYLVKDRFPDKEIVVYIPARNKSRGAATEMRGAADKDAILPLKLLSRCQFPATLTDRSGASIQKPSNW